MQAYLDNSATTRCLDSVANIVAKVMCEDYGNPSSMHMKGVQAENYVKMARNVISKNLKVNNDLHLKNFFNEYIAIVNT